MKGFLPALWILCLAHTTFGQCPGGHCQPSPGPSHWVQGPWNVYNTPAPVYRWALVPGDDNQIALLRDGLQVGNWSFDPPCYNPMYKTSDGRSVWGRQESPPIEPPAPPQTWERRRPRPRPNLADAEDWQTHGVQRENVPSGGLKFSCPGGCDNCGPDCPACGKSGPCDCNHGPRSDAAAEAAIPDYVGLPSFTVVARDLAQGNRVLSDLQNSPALAGYRDKYAPRARVYDPTHFHIADTFKIASDQRFQQTGLAVYVQGPQGADGKAPMKALYGYEGPEQLAAFLRDADPSYDPNKVPAVSSIGFGPGMFGGAVAALMAAVGAAWRKA